jgi:hypothetical protein
VPRDQGCEGELGFYAPVRRESFQQLAIGQCGDSRAVDDRAKLSRHSHSHGPDAPVPVPIGSILGWLFSNMSRAERTHLHFFQYAGWRRAVSKAGLP